MTHKTTRAGDEAGERSAFHPLKTWPEFFDAVCDGRKTFEVRRDDRGFREGDVLLLQRWEPERADYTRDDAGRPLMRAVRVTYVLAGGGFGIEDGHVVLGLGRL